jgi:hypothetical protein
VGRSLSPRQPPESTEVLLTGVVALPTGIFMSARSGYLSHSLAVDGRPGRCRYPTILYLISDVMSLCRRLADCTRFSGQDSLQHIPILMDNDNSVRRWSKLLDDAICAEQQAFHDGAAPLSEDSVIQPVQEARLILVLLLQKLCDGSQLDI